MLTKVIDIDFAKPLQEVYVDHRYGQLFIIARWGYLPLGLLRLRCPANSRTLNAEYLRHEFLQNFGWQLWELAVVKELDAVNHNKLLPPISVIVCTRDRAISLERCLQKLAQLDYPVYEVVVVDNHSRDESVAQVVKQTGFQYVREEIPGLNWARNRGYREAKYDLVAYIDDDALASPGWLRGIAYAFRDPDIMAVTGMVLPAELETAAQNNFEGYGGMSKGFAAFTIQLSEITEKKLFWASSWGVGANMAFRRILFDRVGEFDVALDVGTSTNGGGDIEFFYRVVAAGYTLRYDPAAMIYHVHRRDNESLRQQIYNNGRAFAAYLLTIARNQPNKRFAVLHFALRWWVWEWLIKQFFRTFIRQEQKWAFELAQAELRGGLSSIWAYQNSQKISKKLKTGHMDNGI